MTNFIASKVFQGKYTNELTPNFFLILVLFGVIRVAYAFFFFDFSYFPPTTVLMVLCIVSLVVTERFIKSAFVTSFVFPFLLMLALIVYAIFIYDFLIFVYFIACGIVSVTYREQRGFLIYVGLTSLVFLAAMILFDENLLGYYFTTAQHYLGFLAGIMMNLILYLFLVQHLKLVEKLQETERNAILQSNIKTEFLSRMSHEIRTPLNAVTGLAEVMSKSVEDAKQKDMLKTIMSCCSHLLYLIDEILDFTKIESGKMDIVETEYDLKTVLKEILDVVRPNLKNSHVELDVSLNPSLVDVTIKGDKNKIKQIVINVLTNSVKYTQVGSISLSINARWKFPDKFCLLIDISDTGIGIKQEDLASIYNMFTRFDTKKNTTIQGTGLGLAITHKLVAIMEGTIDVTSEYGKGTKTEIMIPQTISVAPVEKEAKNAERSELNKEAKLLVVDDTETNIVVLQELLELYGFTIDTALSGQEAIEKIKAKDYDLILLDHFMPELDGVETLHHIRRLGSEKYLKLPIVAVTANAIAGAREQLMNEGFDGFLSKPIQTSLLEEILHKFLPSTTDIVV